MEDVLETYQRPRDPLHPQVCVDEASKQLLGDVREPLPAKPGKERREDSEYERHGTANLFMLYAPLEGWRHVAVTERRTAVDFAHVIKDLIDVQFPGAETIVLVMDNLNTHTAASLYEAFPPAEARRLAAKLEIHFTPKHGSWLDMAEMELSVLARQCLADRMDKRESLIKQVAAWETRRNTAHAKTNWRFTTADARIKLRHLYPTVQP